MTPTTSETPPRAATRWSNWLAGLWLLILAFDLVRGVLSDSLISWTTAATVMLCLGGVLSAASLRATAQGRNPAPLGRAAGVAIGLAAAALLMDILR